MKNKYDKAFKDFKAALDKCNIDQTIKDEVASILATNKSFCHYLFNIMHWPCEQIAKITLESREFILNGDLIDENDKEKAPKGRQPGDEE